jgi:hypothetical protein
VIKFRSDSRAGHSVIGLGLSFDNLDRLRAGQSIDVNGADLGLGVGVLLFAAETEAALTQKLVEAGLLPAGTPIRNPKPGEQIRYEKGLPVPSIEQSPGDPHAGHDPEDCEASDCVGCGATLPRCQMPVVPYCAGCRP